MIKGRVTVGIPACNEGFLQATIDSLLSGAQGDVEIIAVIDGGPWPDPPLREDKRLMVLRNNTQLGMRPSFNNVAEIASGEFLMKCDGHCIFAPGWDTALKADCDGDWVAVPTRHSIDGEAWKANPLDGGKAIKGRSYNYHYLTFPFDITKYGYGLHAVTFEWQENRELNKRRAHIPIDDLMSFQGSCWFTTAANFQRLGPLDHQNYYFYQEAQEVGLRQWMTGGRCIINKNTWYAHYHKGKNALHTVNGREGRGFYLSLDKKRKSEVFATDFWLGDKWPGARRTFVQFVERFQWLLDEVKGDSRWPDDWRDFDKHLKAFRARPAEQTPAHI